MVIAEDPDEVNEDYRIGALQAALDAALKLLKEQNDGVIEVLDAESDHNRDEAIRAGCAPGVHLLGGRYQVNAAMYKLSYIGERVKAFLTEHAHEESAK